MNNSVDNLSCKECSGSETEKFGDKVMTAFRKFVERDQSYDRTMELRDEFEKYRQKSKPQRVTRYKKKISVHLDDRSIGWVSCIYVQCNSNPSPTSPLTIDKPV